VSYLTAGDSRLPGKETVLRLSKSRTSSFKLYSPSPSTFGPISLSSGMDPGMASFLGVP